MFDVMHQTTFGWLTMSCYVYDHNYLTLCTIFTCELCSEDTLSQETTWRKMLKVAVENGVSNIKIEGFMAKNS